MSGENPKTVIVTGAASGIGFACVQGLLAAGDRVCRCRSAVGSG